MRLRAPRLLRAVWLGGSAAALLTWIGLAAYLTGVTIDRTAYGDWDTAVGLALWAALSAASAGITWVFTLWGRESMQRLEAHIQSLKNTITDRNRAHYWEIEARVALLRHCLLVADDESLERIGQTLDEWLEEPVAAAELPYRQQHAEELREVLQREKTSRRLDRVMDNLTEIASAATPSTSSRTRTLAL